MRATILALTVYAAIDCAPARAAERLRTPASATIVRVIDGDTFEATVDVWIDMQLTTKVRLDGVDTPEITRAGCDAERSRGLEARDFAQRFLRARRVALHDVRRGKYAGRVVARVTSIDGKDLGDALLTAGLARRYGDRSTDWCDRPANGRRD